MAKIAELRENPTRLGVMISELLSEKTVDLRKVEERLVSETGWTAGKITAVRGRYLKFLLISALVADSEILTPSVEVTKYWNCHTDNPEDYGRFIFNVVGGIIPSNPPTSQEMRLVSLEETSLFYRQVFGEHLEIPKIIRTRKRVVGYQLRSCSVILGFIGL